MSVTTSSPVACLDTTTFPTSLLNLPPGFLCTLAGATSLNMSLNDGNDTGLVNSTSGIPGTLDGGEGGDQLVGGKEDDTFQGGAGQDTAVYAGITQTGLTLARTATVDASLPPRAGPATTGNGEGSESDTINGDVEGLVGGNAGDNLAGGPDPDTIAGAVPAGTPLVQSSPAGADNINGGGGADTLLAGDSGAVNGGPGADQIVGGRSTSATTTVHGNEDNDTIVSGLGDDDLFGDAGLNTLAYASVAQGGLTVVNRGTNGVTARLPNGGQTAPGGRTGGAENDTVHDSFSTLVGSNGNDALTGSDRGDILLGAAPSGTPGVVPGPPGNDALTGGAGTDVILGSTGNDLIRSRDGAAESPVCGGGNDLVAADAFDTLGSDCEVVNRGTSTQPPGSPAPTPGSGVGTGGDTTRPSLSERPAVLVLRRGRQRVAMRLACRNEARGCRGTLTVKTRRRIKLGRRRAQRYTVARFRFRMTNRRSKRFRVRLSRRIFQLVARGESIRLTGTASLRDAAGNRATKTLRLRLNRR